MPERARRRAAGCALGLALALAVCAAGYPLATQAATETRAVDEAERSAFHAWYRTRYPNDHAEQPRFVIERSSPGAAWTLRAVIERQAQRGYRQLCRMRRLEFAFDAATRSWRESGPVRAFAWLNPAAGCAAPARPLELLVRMPDAELAAILAQQASLLASARLLMAGNSDCARQRAFPFALAALDVGAAGAGAEQMVALTYTSERAARATVWVRRNGPEYSPWNVACKDDPR